MWYFDQKTKWSLKNCNYDKNARKIEKAYYQNKETFSWISNCYRNLLKKLLQKLLQEVSLGLFLPRLRPKLRKI